MMNKIKQSYAYTFFAPSSTVGVPPVPCKLKATQGYPKLAKYGINFSPQHQLAWKLPCKNASTGLSYVDCFLLFIDIPNSEEKILSSPPPLDLDEGKHDITSAFVPLPNNSCCVVTGMVGPLDGDDDMIDPRISSDDSGNGTSNAPLHEVSSSRRMTNNSIMFIIHKDVICNSHSVQRSHTAHRYGFYLVYSTTVKYSKTIVRELMLWKACDLDSMIHTT